MPRSIQTLVAAGLPVEEYNQTRNNLTEATEAIYISFINNNLRLYNAFDLREHVLNAVQLSRRAGFGLPKRSKAQRLTVVWLSPKENFDQNEHGITWKNPQGMGDTA
jgi:hypothetical protein